MKVTEISIDLGSPKFHLLYRNKRNVLFSGERNLLSPNITNFREKRSLDANV